MRHCRDRALKRANMPCVKGPTSARISEIAAGGDVSPHSSVNTTGG